MSISNEVIGVTMTAKVVDFTNGFNTATTAVNNLSKGLGFVENIARGAVQTVENVGKKLIGIGIGTTATNALLIHSAMDLETSMRNVNSIMQVNNDQFLKMTQSVIDLSTTVPQSAKANADALYDIASAGYAGADAMVVLKQSAIAATAGLTDTSTASNAIIAAMKAYGESTAQASDISDILFQTVNVGILNFQELTQGMGQWINMAATAKVPLDQAGAALATMTLSGMQADEAATALARVMEQFIKPSDAMTSAVQKLGSESAEAFLKTHGLHDAVTMLVQATGGSNQALGQMFQDVRGLNGVLALSAQNGTLWQKSLDQISDKSSRAGATQKAFREQSQALGAQLKIMTNQLQAIGISIGQYMIPPVKLLVSVMNDLLRLWKLVPGPARGMIAALMLIGGALAAVAGYLLVSNLKWLVFQKTLTLMGHDTAARAVAGIQSISLALIKHGLTLVDTATKTTHYADTFESSMSRIKSSAMSVAAGGAILLAFALAAQNSVNMISDSAKGAADTFMGTLPDPKTFQDRATRINQMIDERDRLLAKRNSGGTGGVVVDFFAGLVGQSGTGTAKAGRESIDIENKLKAEQEAYDNYKQNVQDLSKVTGLSTDAIEKMASTANVDLSGSLDRAGTQAAGLAFNLGQKISPDAQGAAADLLRASQATDTATTATQQLIAQYAQLHGMSGIPVELTDSQKTLARSLSEIGSSSTALDDMMKKKITDKTNAVSDQQKAIQDQAEKEQKAIRDTGDARQKELEKHKKRNQDEIDALGKTTDAAIQASKDKADAEIASLDKQKTAIQDTQATIKDYTNSFNEGTTKANAYAEGLSKFSQRVGAQKNAFGGQQFSATEADALKQYVVGLGADGMKFLDSFNSSTLQQQQDALFALSQNLKATDQNRSVEIQTAMAAAAEVGKQGADATAQTIAAALGLDKNAALFNQVGVQWGLQLSQGIAAGATGGVKTTSAADKLGEVTPGPGVNLSQHQILLFDNESRFSLVNGHWQADGGGEYVLRQAGSQRFLVKFNQGIGGAAYDKGRIFLHDDMPRGNKRYTGGPVSPFGSYDVGEYGPEKLIMGPQGGYVVPVGRHPVDFMPKSPISQNIYNKKMNYHFSGDMVMTDPKATIRYAERKSRANARQGVSNYAGS